MAHTLGSMAEEVLSLMQGSGVTNDQIVTLTQALTSTDTEFTVDDETPLVRGLIEIDTEQMWVSSVTSGTVYIPPWGRGYRGTDAAAHAIYSAVRVSPTWPRSVLHREINSLISGLYPDLFAVKSTEIAMNSSLYQYELPADVEHVLGLQAARSVREGWFPVTKWDDEQDANTTDYTTGKMLTLADALPSGVTLRVTYAARPTELTASTDLFTATGLPESCRDVVILGTAVRLFPWSDIATIPDQSVEARSLAQAKPFGAAVTAARDFRAEYEKRRKAESNALNNKYSRRLHRTR